MLDWQTRSHFVFNIEVGHVIVSARSHFLQGTESVIDPPGKDRPTKDGIRYQINAA